MTGKTADEIIAVVGPPSSTSSLAFGQTLMQWQATGCHIALLFGANGQFMEITHQYAQYAPAPSGCMSMIAVVLVILASTMVASIRVFR